MRRWASDVPRFAAAALTRSLLCRHAASGRPRSRTPAGRRRCRPDVDDGRVESVEGHAAGAAQRHRDASRRGTRTTGRCPHRPRRPRTRGAADRAGGGPAAAAGIEEHRIWFTPTTLGRHTRPAPRPSTGAVDDRHRPIPTVDGSAARRPTRPLAMGRIGARLGSHAAQMGDDRGATGGQVDADDVDADGVGADGRMRRQPLPARRRSRPAFAGVIASIGEPNRRLVRVFTSTTTRQLPSRATRSSSPCRLRQFASSSS